MVVSPDAGELSKKHTRATLQKQAEKYGGVSGE
jgi:hypothetical protein